MPAIASTTPSQMVREPESELLGNAPKETEATVENSDFGPLKISSTKTQFRADSNAESNADASGGAGEGGEEAGREGTELVESSQAAAGRGKGGSQNRSANATPNERTPTRSNGVSPNDAGSTETHDPEVLKSKRENISKALEFMLEKGGDPNFLSLEDRGERRTLLFLALQEAFQTGDFGKVDTLMAHPRIDPTIRYEKTEEVGSLNILLT